MVKDWEIVAPTATVRTVGETDRPAGTGAGVGAKPELATAEVKAKAAD